jgi:hypothetical protein
MIAMAFVTYYYSDDTLTSQEKNLLVKDQKQINKPQIENKIERSKSELVKIELKEPVQLLSNNQIKKIDEPKELKFDLNTSFESPEYYDSFLKAFKEDNYSKVISISQNLLMIPDHYKSQFWYGDLCHAVYILLGKTYLAHGEIHKAQEALIKSVNNKCVKNSQDMSYSPVLSSFGPDRTLAYSLFEKGKKGTVIKFFELTKKFWESGVEEGVIDRAIANLLVVEKNYEQEDDPYFPFKAIGHTVNYEKAPMRKSVR